MENTTEMIVSDNDLKDLGFGADAYKTTEFHYIDGESPSDRADTLLTNPENVSARKQMLLNVNKLDDYLGDALVLEKTGEKSFDKQLKSIFVTIAKESAYTLENPAREESLRFIENLDAPGMLFSHLDESGESGISLFKGLSDVIKKDGLLTPRHAKLMEFALKTHDLSKLVGSINAQIDPDHEVIYIQVVGKHLEGKTFYSSDGEKITFTKDDVNFITNVVGFHEDIYREEDFAKQSELLRKSNNLNDPNVAVGRARAIMHFIDIFGNAIGFDKGQLKIKDKDAFEKRFVDLYRRHIRLPLLTKNKGLTIWKNGKAYRPEWGLHGVGGLTWTFGILKSDWGVNIDPDLIPSVQNGIFRVLTEAQDAIKDVRGAGLNYFKASKGDAEYSDVETELTTKLKNIQDIHSKLEKEFSD